MDEKGRYGSQWGIQLPHKTWVAACDDVDGAVPAAFTVVQAAGNDTGTECKSRGQCKRFSRTFNGHVAVFDRPSPADVKARLKGFGTSDCRKRVFFSYVEASRRYTRSEILARHKYDIVLGKFTIG
ncbi:hypothetical protein SLA2020_100730 [Shorea laevis]